MEKIYCEKCSKELNPKKIVWLYYDRKNNKYVTWEMDEQFSFGKDCAKKIIHE